MLRRCIERTIPNLDIYLLLFLYNRIFSFCHIVYYVILPSLKEDLWAYYRGAHFSYFDLTYHKKNFSRLCLVFFQAKKMKCHEHFWSIHEKVRKWKCQFEFINIKQKLWFIFYTEKFTEKSWSLKVKREHYIITYSIIIGPTTRNAFYKWMINSLEW